MSASLSVEPATIRVEGQPDRPAHADEEHYVLLKANNGLTLMHSQNYASKWNAERAIDEAIIDAMAEVVIEHQSRKIAAELGREPADLTGAQPLPHPDVWDDGEPDEDEPR